MRPDEEDAIWASESNPYPRSGSPPNAVMATRFPELVTAGGGVNTEEAIVSLLDRIKQLEARVASMSKTSKL